MNENQKEQNKLAAELGFFDCHFGRKVQLASDTNGGKIFILKINLVIKIG